MSEISLRLLARHLSQMEKFSLSRPTTDIFCGAPLLTRSSLISVAMRLIREESFPVYSPTI